MAVFDEVKLAWNGEPYSIPPDQVLRVIAKVESVITLPELSRSMVYGNVPLAKLSEAFGIVLRHAGAKVSDEEVYTGMFAEGKVQARAMAAIAALQELMIPPEHMRRTQQKVKRGAASRRAASSRKRTSS